MQFPKTEFAAAFESVNVSAGVLVAVATLDVNRGERFPALKLVTPAVPLHDAKRREVSPELDCKHCTPDGAVEETESP